MSSSSEVSGNFSSSTGSSTTSTDDQQPKKASPMPPNGKDGKPKALDITSENRSSLPRGAESNTVLHTLRPTTRLDNLNIEQCDRPSTMCYYVPKIIFSRDQVRLADVLFGRGANIFNHAGNRQFLSEKLKLEEDYYKAKYVVKSTISKQLVDIMRELGGDFLKCADKKKDLWYVACDACARFKAAQVLRERFSSEDRRLKNKHYRRKPVPSSTALPESPTGNNDKAFTGLKSADSVVNLEKRPAALKDNVLLDNEARQNQSVQLQQPSGGGRTTKIVFDPNDLSNDPNAVSKLQAIQFILARRQAAARSSLRMEQDLSTLAAYGSTIGVQNRGVSLMSQFPPALQLQMQCLAQQQQQLAMQNQHQLIMQNQRQFAIQRQQQLAIQNLLPPTALLHQQLYQGGVLHQPFTAASNTFMSMMTVPGSAHINLHQQILNPAAAPLLVASTAHRPSGTHSTADKHPGVDRSDSSSDNDED